MRESIQEKNNALHNVFNSLKAKNEKNIWLLPAAEVIGTDNEATVDGIHFTDLGFMRYADYLYDNLPK
jgi:hypothetical protein